MISKYRRYSSASVLSTAIRPMAARCRPLETSNSTSAISGPSACNIAAHENVSEKIVVRTSNMESEEKLFELVDAENQCHVCHKLFADSSYLEIHMRRHKNDKIFRCKAEGCGKRFVTDEELTSHERTHSKSRPYTCINCPKTFKRAHHLKAHVDEYHTLKFRNQQCSVCGKNFTRHSSLKRHAVVHFSLETKPNFNCSICNKGFHTKDYLQQHCSKHEEVETFLCDICERSFQWKKSLIRHKSYKHSKQLQSFSCLLCKKHYKSDQYLKIHTKQVHEKKDLIPCQTCVKSFATRSILKQHGQCHKSVKCDICAKTMKERSLARHMRCEHVKKERLCSD